MEQNEVFRKSNLERISSPERLNDYIKVISPSVVLLMSAMALLLVGALVWGFFGNIPLTKSATGAFYASQPGGGCDRLAVVVPAEEIGELQTGMEVQVSPASASRETYGFIRGKIAEIADYPVSHDELLKLLQNEQLTALILPETAGILVTVELEQNPESVSGLNWSSSKGDEVPIRQGMTAAALIVLKNQKPLDLITE